MKAHGNSSPPNKAARTKLARTNKTTVAVHAGLVTKTDDDYDCNHLYGQIRVDNIDSGCAVLIARHTRTHTHTPYSKYVTGLSKQTGVPRIERKRKPNEQRLFTTRVISICFSPADARGPQNARNWFGLTVVIREHQQKSACAGTTIGATKLRGQERRTVHLSPAELSHEQPESTKARNCLTNDCTSQSGLTEH